ncbi:hypothetical protein KRX57_09140 [Weeksellaceae bacterium TAE3-ERU29]|nr:hypothetical protein [Weeksellaceae bacterium TAE3-ERU29]
MKRIKKFFIGIIVISLVTIGYFYLKPAIELKQLPVEKDIPIKIQVIGRNQITAYIPYKFKISNNRFEKLKLSYIDDSLDNYSSRDLIFDANGDRFSNYYDDNTHKIDSLLHEKEIFKYLSLKYNATFFPFTSRDIYFFRAKKINMDLTKKDVTLILKDFGENQIKNLKSKPNPIIYGNLGIELDKLQFQNHKLYFYFDPINSTTKSYSKYKIFYNLKDNHQEIENIYEKFNNMTKKEIIEYMHSSNFDY